MKVTAVNFIPRWFWIATASMSCFLYTTIKMLNVLVKLAFPVAMGISGTAPEFFAAAGDATLFAVVIAKDSTIQMIAKFPFIERTI